MEIWKLEVDVLARKIMPTMKMAPLLYALLPASLPDFRMPTVRGHHLERSTDLAEFRHPTRHLVGFHHLGQFGAVLPFGKIWPVNDPPDSVM
jgi:hypothetical protein